MGSGQGIEAPNCPKALVGPREIWWAEHPSVRGASDHRGDPGLVLASDLGWSESSGEDDRKRTTSLGSRCSDLHWKVRTNEKSMVLRLCQHVRALRREWLRCSVNRPRDSVQRGDKGRCCLDSRKRHLNDGHCHRYSDRPRNLQRITGGVGGRAFLHPWARKPNIGFDHHGCWQGRQSLHVVRRDGVRVDVDADGCDL